MKKYLFILVMFTLISCKSSQKNIFLIGDSISIEYGPYLKEHIADIANMERKEDDGTAFKNLDVPMGANGGDSHMVLLYLRHKLQEQGFSPDYMLLNCGLHDIKRHPETSVIQVTENDYCTNLAEIFHILKEKNINPIWIRTTWVVDSIHNAKSKAFSRYNKDVLRYNEIADSVCIENEIPIIDLYTFTMNLGVDELRDHVHYFEDAQKKQAAFIASRLRKYIK
ncbi:SGNH/GDSL hydrolase family protein [Bacteroides uniformis]|uniref:SGNH/GDSL hydrolase family protein n=1 Tax=Bacteroides uniformis TaxID=820 RepID=UPI003512226D